MSKPVAYIAGVYSNGNTLSEEEMVQNKQRFRDMQLKLYKAGFSPINPIEMDCWADLSFKEVIECDLSIIKKCDVAIFMNGWAQSAGARMEHECAKENGVLILYYQ